MPGWDETENEWRYRFREPGLFDKERTADITAGVYIVYGRLKGSTKWKPQAIRFKKESFKLPAAKKWLADHPDIRGNSRPSPELLESVSGFNAVLNGVEWEDTGEAVVFKNVPFAAEGCFDSPDGAVGYRSREELEKMVPFSNSLRIVIRHPAPTVSQTATIDLKSEDFPIIGWTSNAHLTELEGVARINADLAILKEDRAGNDRTGLIEKMKKAQVRELSIGYFYDPVPAQGSANGREYDHLETDVNPYHLAVLPESGTAQCQPPLCGIGCASCSRKIAGAMNGDGSGTTGGIDTTPEEEKKAKEAAAQVAAMNLNALANSNAEVKTLIEKMNAMTKEIEDGKKAQAALDARVKKGDEALAVLEKQKAEAREARVKALKEGMGEDEFGKIFPDEASIQSASDIELGRLETMLNLSTESKTEAPDAPTPPAPGGASKGLKVPAPAAGKTATPKPGENAAESGRLPNVFKPLAYRPIKAHGSEE